jgi:hypothetical protein
MYGILHLCALPDCEQQGYRCPDLAVCQEVDDLQHSLYRAEALTLYLAADGPTVSCSCSAVHACEQLRIQAVAVTYRSTATRYHGLATCLSRSLDPDAQTAAIDAANGCQHGWAIL